MEENALTRGGDIQDSVRGCLLGGAIGDALGSPYEGLPGPVEFNDDAPIVLTDDTQLTLATCVAIARAHKVDPELIAREMAAWFQQNRLTRVGSGTLKALRELSQGAHWALCGRRGEMAAGSGPAARSAPLAYWLDPADPLDRVTIRDVARITHHSDEAYAGALAVVAAVRAASRGEFPIIGEVLPLLPDTNVRDRLAALSNLSATSSLAALAAESGSSGYVVEAVPLALCAAERMLQVPLLSIMRELISLGGDTDTIASLAGQVAGAAIGARALPHEAVSQIPGIAEVEAVAEKFVLALREPF